VSTSEAQVFARALYDALLGDAFQALRTAASKLESESEADADPEARITAALPPDAPREVRNFLLVLAREDALDRLPAIVRAFERYIHAGAQTIDGEVVSAIELDEAQRERITNELRARYGDQLQVRFRVDPSLIGGLIIRIGDQVLDNSLRTRLSAIQRNMLAG
jgi:F-type H+-transporting ATPase subunit delta